MLTYMIRYKKVEDNKIKDISYTVDYYFIDDYEKRANVDMARCDLKISSHNGYLDVFVSPKPKSNLKLSLTPLDQCGDQIDISINKDEWEDSNVARWKNLVL